MTAPPGFRVHHVEIIASDEPVRVDAFTDRRCTLFRDPDELPIELYEAE